MEFLLEIRFFNNDSVKEILGNYILKNLLKIHLFTNLEKNLSWKNRP
jgi:hypothetical protein